MNTKIVPTYWKPFTTAFLLVALLLAPLSAFAAGMTQTDTVRAAELSGTLNSSNTRHYLTLEPSERDGEVVLTLTFGPQSDGRVASKANFWVLSETALQQTVDASVPYYQVALAAGSPISGKSDDYKVQANFKVTGKQPYVVIVYSKAPVAVDYTLTAQNAMLVDMSGQTQTAAMATAAAPVAEQATATPTETMMSAAPTSATPTVTASLPTTTVKDTKRVQGTSNGNGEQLYYTIVPVDNDEDVTVNFDYDPKDIGDLNSQINFYIFDTNGLDQLRAGARPEFANLGAGGLVKSDGTARTATFRAVGKQTYVVMVMNRSNVPATFTLTVSGADFQ
ncbi:MAG: hypothetical protein U0175_10135 [Caldilineaceae bacterium]